MISTKRTMRTVRMHGPEQHAPCSPSFFSQQCLHIFFHLMSYEIEISSAPLCLFPPRQTWNLSNSEEAEGLPPLHLVFQDIIHQLLHLFHRHLRMSKDAAPIARTAVHGTRRTVFFRPATTWIPLQRHPARLTLLVYSFHTRIFIVSPGESYPPILSLYTWTRFPQLLM